MFGLQKIKKEIEIEGFHSIYYFEFGKEFTHAPEKHDFWEMVYVDEGEIISVTNGVLCALEQGQVIFHEPNEAHAHISNNYVANNMLVISFTSRSEIMEYFKGKIFTLDKTTKTLLSLFMEEAKNALGEIPADYENKEDLCFLPEIFGSSQLLLGYFTEFLIKLVRDSNSVSSLKNSRTVANNSITEGICNYMQSNVYSNITLKDVCSQFFQSKTKLCKIFNESTGQSPMQYYSDLKIKEAKKLIREKNHSLTEISKMLGYSSIHNFSRSFKNNVGMSPRGQNHLL